jgi:hypothetical protein
MRTSSATFSLLLLSLFGTTAIAGAGDLKITGEGIQAASYNEQAFSALPHKAVTVTEHGQTVTYDAVSLNDLLTQAGAPLGKNLKGKAFRLGLLAKASDGYAVLLALSSLDADFGGLEVYIADKQGGKALSDTIGPFRLVVVGDKRPARSVRMLTEISVIDIGGGQK